jgi:hypothetical protein
MSAASTQAALILAALLLALASFGEMRALRASGGGTPPWVPLAVFTGLAIASIIFGLGEPELVILMFGGA